MISKETARERLLPGIDQDLETGLNVLRSCSDRHQVLRAIREFRNTVLVPCGFTVQDSLLRALSGAVQTLPADLARWSHKQRDQFAMVWNGVRWVVINSASHNGYD